MNLEGIFSQFRQEIRVMFAEHRERIRQLHHEPEDETKGPEPGSPDDVGIPIP